MAETEHTKKAQATESTALDVSPPLEKSSSCLSWRFFGPGMLCCLADTDAGCLITAGQSGARWGYSLLPLQVCLIPILFAAQELTVRLGVYSRQGHTACIRDHFGAGWAWIATVFLLVECVGAMVSEMSGIATVAELWGATRYQGAFLGSAIVIFTVLSLRYRQIEAFGIILGLFELTFVISMFCVRPSPGAVLKDSLTFHNDSEYIMLVSSNIGAVIMPWMIYFQQSAVVARRIVDEKGLAVERSQTLIGCCLTQVVMIGTLVTMAASPMKRADIESAHDFVVAMEPSLGYTTSKIFVSCALVGGSLCAALVVTLAPAWAVCEAAGIDARFSLDQSLIESPIFYLCFMLVICTGWCVLVTGVDIIKLNLYIELMDGLLMPMALGMLFILASTELLPESQRLRGFYKWLLAVVFISVMAVSLACGFYGLYHTDHTK